MTLLAPTTRHAQPLPDEFARLLDQVYFKPRIDRELLSTATARG
jgi:hypothetical protein